MQCDPNLVKVCVNVDGVGNLHTIDKSVSLDKIVEELCKTYNKVRCFELHGCNVPIHSPITSSVSCAVIPTPQPTTDNSFNVIMPIIRCSQRNKSI